MAEYTDAPRYVKRQETFTAIKWDGTQEAGGQIIKTLGGMFARVLLNQRYGFDLHLNQRGIWNLVDVGDWIVIGSGSSKMFDVDYQVLTDIDFQKTYQKVES